MGDKVLDDPEDFKRKAIERARIVKRLLTEKTEISLLTEKYLSEIDEAIKLME